MRQTMDRRSIDRSARAQMAILVIQTPSRIGAHHGRSPRVDGRVDIKLEKMGAWCGLGRGSAPDIQDRIAVRGEARVSRSPAERARYARCSEAWYGLWNPTNSTRTRSAVRLRGGSVEYGVGKGDAKATAGAPRLGSAGGEVSEHPWPPA